MKSILIIFCLFVFTTTNAQTGTEILFKKGAELEYKTYYPLPKMGGKYDLHEVTRITLVVTEVKDSNNTTYSYITKKGHAIKYPEVGYERKLVIMKTADKIIIPQDLFVVDTVYRVDILPEGPYKKGSDKFFATTTFKDKNNMVLAIDFEKGKFDFEPKTSSAEVSYISAGTNPNNPNYGIVETSKYTMNYTVKESKVEEKMNVTTEAGTFDCYKISSSTEVKMWGQTSQSKGTFFYSPTYGFLKAVALQMGQEITVFELVKVKKL